MIITHRVRQGSFTITSTTFLDHNIAKPNITITPFPNPLYVDSTMPCLYPAFDTGAGSGDDDSVPGIIFLVVVGMDLVTGEDTPAVAVVTSVVFRLGITVVRDDSNG